MSINVNLQVVPFGQIIFKTDLPVYEEHQSLPDTVREEFQYREPQQTVPLVYEIIYNDQQLTDFTVPSSTAYH
jgi:hypothetical protein